MKLPPKTKAKLCGRFDHLATLAQELLAKAEKVPTHEHYSETWGIRTKSQQAYIAVPRDPFVVWRTHAITLLDQVVPRESPHRGHVNRFSGLKPSADDVRWGLSFLQGIRDDFEQGMLDEMSARIEAEISVDYLGQAEALLKGEQRGACDHVPAAVLAGAVLERHLRMLCAEADPPLALTDAKGNPKGMNALIDDLKKSGAFNELTAKQLRAWADIRNAAAHGQFEKFTPAQVESMLAALPAFLQNP